MSRKILYFMGAGLTKALEQPGRPIPLMNDFVSVMADYIYDERHPAQYDQVILASLVGWELAGVHVWES